MKTDLSLVPFEVTERYEDIKALLAGIPAVITVGVDYPGSVAVLDPDHVQPAQKLLKEQYPQVFVSQSERLEQMRTKTGPRTASHFKVVVTKGQFKNA